MDLVAVRVLGDGPGIHRPAIVELGVAFLRGLGVRRRRALGGAELLTRADAVPVVAWVRTAGEEAGRWAVGGHTDLVPVRALIGEPRMEEGSDRFLRTTAAHVAQVHEAE